MPRRSTAARGASARKALMGHRVKRLRRERSLTQAALAERLGISASYLNLIEHNQRPLTVSLQLRLAELFQTDLSAFGPDDEARLLNDLTEVFGDGVLRARHVDRKELRELVEVAPAAGRSLVALYHALLRTREELRALTESAVAGRVGAGPRGELLPPEEEVSDFLQANNNHFAELETAAEALRARAGLESGDLDRRLIDLLRREHDVEVVVAPADAGGEHARRYDPDRRRLVLSEVLAPRSRSFQLAHQFALLAERSTIERFVQRGRLVGPDAKPLARIALANYFAGAVLMPYEPFLAAARSVRYDIELLGHRFRTSFEQVCHRLTTLQRPTARGVPFHFVRVDIAGNTSKRFSASGIRFARFSGSCPRWNVHAAFLSPGFIRTQLSCMPDGTMYFCIARTVRREGGGFHVPQSRLAIGLGCEVRYARELVYADGVDLDDASAAVPIGVTCRLCERGDCRQRAFPPLHHDLNVDENVRGMSFYQVPEAEGP